MYSVVYQRVENYVILPKVMTKAIDLSAPTVIVTILIESSLAGLTGALIALPNAAAIKVTLRGSWAGIAPTASVEPASSGPVEP